jgi:hypothetical protein
MRLETLAQGAAIMDLAFAIPAAPVLRLVLCVTDPEVAHELLVREEGGERDDFARQALRLGVIAMRHASGAIDAQSIQRESERMLGGVRAALTAHSTETAASIARLLGGYLDPASGSLPQRLDRLTKRDGEIESMLGKHLEGDRSTIATTLARQVGKDSPLFKLLSPTQTGGVVVTLSRAIEEALRVQRDVVLREFSRDQPGSALSRLIEDVTIANGTLRGELANDIAAMTGSLSLDNEQGPMARFVARIEKAQRTVLEQFSLDCEGSAICRLAATLDDTRATVKKSLTLDDPSSPLSLLRKELMDAVGAFTDANGRFQADVQAKLDTFRVRREEAARSSLHGHSFEYSAGEVLQLEARHAGDVCERLSGTPGVEGRKTGDYVMTLGTDTAAPGARIVFECKAEKNYTEAQAFDELALARKNRGAQFGVFVVARESAKEGFSPFRRVGTDLLVIWDADDPGTDVYLKAAVSVARALVVEHHRCLDRAHADVREVEQSIAIIERLVIAVESIAHDARNIVKKGTKIAKSAEVVKERLVTEVERLKAVLGPGGNVG